MARTAEYNFQTIEAHWQKFWADNKTFHVEKDASKKKYWVLDMFPYPSGAGLHVGHIEGDTATDIMGRYKKANGFNEADVERITQKFIMVMEVCRYIFGKYAFRKYNKDYRRGPINKAIFEIWAICFGELNCEQLDKIKNNKDEFVDRFGDLLMNGEFSMALKGGDQYSFAKRIFSAPRA